MTLRRCLPPFAGSAVLFLVFVVGCKPRQFSTIAENDVAISAEAERTAARLLQKHNPFVMPSAMPTHIPWNFGGWMVRQGGLEVSNVESRVFPQGHPATVLTQKMVHRIHAAAVASIPALRGIPEPMVTVLKDPEPNAFTSTGVICLPVPIVPDAPNAFSPEPAPEKEWITAFGGKLYPGEIGRMVGGVQGESCPAGVEARANLVPQLLQSLRLGSPECQPALKNGTLVISQQCYNSVALPGGARGVLHLAAAASIVVHAGLLAKFDERHVEAAVAHEMAHYYRNHVAKTLTSEQQVSYFFRIPDYQNRSAVPPRDDSPETKALANELGTTQSSVPFVISGLQNHPSAARLAKFICQNSIRAKLSI